MTDFNQLLQPDQRRRLGQALMAQQFDRPTPQDSAVTERATMLPFGTYENGQTALAIPGLLTEPVEAFNRLLQNGYQSGDARGAVDGFNVAGAAMMGGLAAPRPRGSLGMSGKPEQPKGITAYHGSPHDFDRFDMTKIGTGEGAQAYGHGLYFAEKEGVARNYRDALSGQRFKDGSAFDDANPAHQASSYIAGTKSKEEALAAINEDIAMSRRQMDEKHAQILLRAKGIVERGEKIPEINPGRMYEVKINAHADDFLDWDKPLSQQSEKVRASLESFDPTTSLYSDAYKTGDVINQIRGPKGEIERKLKDAGIPGIRYLDQGSRAAGYGSRNYVVFDENLINILRKYGLMGMVGGEAANAMMQNYGQPGQPKPQPRIPDDAA